MFKKDRSKLDNKKKKQAPAKVNNFLTCKTTVARSLNIQPLPTIKKRNVEEVKQIVNAKDGKDLVHKPKDLSGQKEFPVIDDGKSKTQQPRSSKKDD